MCSVPTDKFGDPVRTPTGLSSACPLSAAQEAARASRERACRSLPLSSSSARAHLLNAGAVRLLCDSVALGDLAGDDLRRATATRHVLRCTREQLRGTAAEPELNAAVDLYNAIVTRTERSLPAAALALWGRSLAFSAECYFADSPRHYAAVLAAAGSKLTSAMSPELSETERLRAEEALGRVLLLQVRRSVYSGEQGWELPLERAASVLRTAAVRCARSDSATPSTAPYDAARAAALKGDADACREWLEAARDCEALPPLRVMRVEPDFSLVRDAPWFRSLCSAAAGASSGGDESYSVLRDGLIGRGFAVEPILEHLRFPLYMDKPRGTHVAGMVKEAEDQEAKEALAAVARERLLKRLQSYGLKAKREIPGDGNCQFSAVSDQLWDTIDENARLRKEAVDWLRCHADWHTGNGASLHWFVDEDWADYCSRMAKPGTWGDHLTLIALCECLGVAITVVSSVEGDNFLTEIKPSEEALLKCKTGARVLLLSHYAEFHYGSSLYTRGGEREAEREPRRDYGGDGDDDDLAEARRASVMLAPVPPPLTSDEVEALLRACLRHTGPAQRPVCRDVHVLAHRASGELFDLWEAARPGGSLGVADGAVAVVASAEHYGVYEFAVDAGRRAMAVTAYDSLCKVTPLFELAVLDAAPRAAADGWTLEFRGRALGWQDPQEKAWSHSSCGVFAALCCAELAGSPPGRCAALPEPSELRVRLCYAMLARAVVPGGPEMPVPVQ
eukprot:m51a1_g5524 hypothetical protein (734) ;mRNA; r:424710-427715